MTESDGSVIIINVLWLLGLEHMFILGGMSALDFDMRLRLYTFRAVP